MRMSLWAALCAAVLLAPAQGYAADPAAGKSYFNKKCAICHGKTAKGKGSFPSLKGRDTEYLIDRLKTYRSRGKVGPNSALMYSHAGKLDDAEITNIAIYLATTFGTSTPEQTALKAAPAPKKQPPAKPAKKAKKSSSTNTIACAQEQGEALGQCTYQVKHGKDGKTALTATFSNNFKRMLFFKGGEFLKANATMSGVGTDTDWALKDDTHTIRVDDQRYIIPAALVAPTKPAATAEKPDTGEAPASIDLAKGKKHFRKNCRACHGSKAQGVASYPKLAGQPADYLAKRLKQYRSGETLGPNTPLMAPRAKKLSDTDIDNIVAYIGTFN